MKKLANSLVKRRSIIFIVVLLLTIVSGFLIPKVNVVTDMTKFLPDDSQMRKGVEIISEEFSDTTMLNTIRVMFTGVPETEKSLLKEQLAQIEYVDSVSYEVDHKAYNEGEHTLYVLNIPYDYRSTEMNAVEKTVDNQYSDTYQMVYSVDDTNGGDVPLWIMGLALVIMMIILFAMSYSWVEPLLFLVTIGFAVVINMGTNILLPQVSQVTYSIVALLQLVLSMDYSIILMNRYRQELESRDNCLEAMEKAISGAFSSIASSSVTTIVGLLTLVFMSFKIGEDLGIVLAKGVLISLICVILVLPALILFFDKAIRKTAKKVIHIPMNKIGKFSFKCRYPMVIALVVLFITMFFLQRQSHIVFTMQEETAIDEVFPQSNAIIVLYDNKDEEVIRGIVPEIEQMADVENVMAYGNTLGKAYTSIEMVEMMKSSGSEGDFAIDSSMLDIIYSEYYKKEGNPAIKLETFLSFIESNEMIAGQMDEQSKAQLAQIKPFSSKEELSKERTSEELAMFLGVDQSMIDQLLLVTGKSSISMMELLQMFSQNNALSEFIAPEQQAQMQSLQTIIMGVMTDKTYTAKELAELFSGISTAFTEEQVELVYTLYFSQNSDDTWTLTIPQMLDFVINDIAENPKYASFIDEHKKAQLLEAKKAIESGSSQMRGQNYSLMMINTYLPAESEQTTVFFEALEKKLDEKTSNSYYLIGNSPMAFEMGKTFSSEQQKITILTAIAVFLVVLITFRNIVIPIVLIVLIQTAVYATTSVMNIQGMDINYLALLIVQSILMGATIDYAIVYVSYYRENRAKKGIKEAIVAAYEGALHTILTSGLIMIVVTAIVGYAFEDPAIGQIVHTISKGAAISILLILFILPGVLAVLDRWVCKERVD